MQLVGAVDRGRVDGPLLLREDEGTKLLAPDGAVAAGLILEVDLLAFDERPEDDQVARVVERVEARHLGPEDRRIVMRGEYRLELRAAEFLASSQENVPVAIARHDECDLLELGDRSGELRVAGAQLRVVHACAAIRKVEVRQAARNSDVHATDRPFLWRAILLALVLLDTKSRQQRGHP